MKEDKKEQTDEFKLGFDTGVMMLSELLLMSLETGVKLGYGKSVPTEIMEQFIKVHAFELSKGELRFKDLKNALKTAAENLGREPGKVH